MLNETKLFMFESIDNDVLHLFFPIIGLESSDPSADKITKEIEHFFYLHGIHILLAVSVLIVVLFTILIILFLRKKKSGEREPNLVTSDAESSPKTFNPLKAISTHLCRKSTDFQRFGNEGKFCHLQNMFSLSLSYCDIQLKRLFTL